MANIADEIRLCGPDVVLLQEAWFERIATLLEKHLGGAYARVPDDSGVRAGLHGILGVRRGGLLAFVRVGSAWKLEPPGQSSAFTIYESAAPWYKLWELDGVSSKGIQRFALRSGERHLIVINTHLQSQYGKCREYERVRSEQIGQIVRESGDSVHVVLVAGDFNTNADEKLHDVLVSDFEDLTGPLRERSGGGTHYDKGKESGWIDYVFARRGKRVVVRGARLITNIAEDDPYSDHHGVWVWLTIER